MLDKEILNNFTKEASKAWQQFCVWKYSSNNFIECQKEFNKSIKDGFCFSEEETIDNSCKYKNFWDVIIYSLQGSWILSIARLIDPPYFLGDKDKPRLSIYYILELLDDDFKQKLKDELNNFAEFIESIKKCRDNFLAHNSIDYSDNNIKAGVEDFFSTLNCFIKRIKDKYPHLKECNDINLIFTEGLSKAGVKEVFEKIK